MTTPEQIGKQLAQARQSRGVRQEVLAGHLGVSLNTLRNYERGETDISYIQVCKAAEFLGVDVDWFASDGVEALA